MITTTNYWCYSFNPTGPQLRVRGDQTVLPSRTEPKVLRRAIGNAISSGKRVGLTDPRARHAGQDLHHLVEVSRCSVCTLSPRVGYCCSIGFFGTRSADCNGCRGLPRTGIVLSPKVSVVNRNAPRTAARTPSRHTGTVLDSPGNTR